MTINEKALQMHEQWNGKIETTATVLAFIVYLYAASLSFAMTLHGSATPGV